MQAIPPQDKARGILAKKMMKAHITVILLFLFSSFIFAGIEPPTNQDTAPGLNEFYLDSERGWFWYEINENGEKVKKYKEPKKAEQPTVIPKQKTSPKPQVKPEDQSLSQAWFRKNFPKYRDRAIENPHDKEAMRTYLYLEKFMRERAMKFGYARQAAVYAEPFLDATANRATANFGMKDMNIDASNNKQASLKKLGEKSGVFFFYRSDCPYCKRQMPLIKLLETQYGFSIQPVSLDGKALPDSPWENFLVNTNQAQQLGVAKVPAMYLYEPESQKVELIAQGLQSLSQLEKRIMYSAHRVGLISDDEIQKMRPTGLYQNIDGEIGTQIAAPSNAPEEFKKLVTESLKFQKTTEKEFSYDEE
ncbi:conjugal transfer protein TraF [Psychromonas aquimarina]|uniref:conjugal transfer protein TraF n=1 Tax=Psychromonas aquimarina TaxID=444919 RepID=UPI0006880BBF|nr:conjugal transfer protein TraF [Psychromonas aquimarina]